MPRNLGISTDLMFNRQMGNVLAAEPYLVVTTPDAPDFYFGNMLVLDKAPGPGSRAQLEADFARLVGQPPTIRHKAFVWPARKVSQASLSDFVDAGYELQESAVLVARVEDLKPASPAQAPLTVRPFESENDWHAWTTLMMKDNAAHFPDAAYHSYLDAHRLMYRRLIRAGKESWWGAYLDGTLVAHAGLFIDAGVGRFQSVLTAPEHRGLGICGDLIHRVARWGFARARRLVMVADEAHQALRIYKRLGFVHVDRMASLCQW